MIIYLDRLSPDGSSDLPGSRRAALCSLFGLASSGVYMCPLCYQRGGSLLHCLSTLTCAERRRFISVALSLESPPPDVIWHPALWSPDFPLLHPFGHAAAIICLTQNESYYITLYFFCPVWISNPVLHLYFQTASTYKFTKDWVLRYHITVYRKEIIQEF